MKNKIKVDHSSCNEERPIYEKKKNCSKTYGLGEYEMNVPIVQVHTHLRRPAFALAV